MKPVAGYGLLTEAPDSLFNPNNQRCIWPAPFDCDVERQKANPQMDDSTAESLTGSQPGFRATTQRGFMRDLVTRFGMDEVRVITEYAAAEVRRMSNEYNTTPEQYARALWNDGVKKGWLRA